jgi:hypothetical protein
MNNIAACSVRNKDAVAEHEEVCKGREITEEISAKEERVSPEPSPLLSGTR